MYITGINYEGSPKLGYLSHDQVQEHAQSHLGMDERQAGFLADKVFRQIGRTGIRIDQMSHREGSPTSELGELVLTPDADTSYSDWEVGWGGLWDEVGILVESNDSNLLNLDYFMSQYDGETRKLKKNFTAQVADILSSYITERQIFLDSTTEV